MLDRCPSIYPRFMWGTAALGCPPGEARQMPGIESRNFGHKKAGTQIWSRHSSWLVARRKSKDFKVSKASRFQPEAIPHDLETLKPCHFQTLPLRRPPRPDRQIPNLRQNARHLHAIQLRNKRQQLGDELILHQFADLF